MPNFLKIGSDRCKPVKTQDTRIPKESQNKVKKQRVPSSDKYKILEEEDNETETTILKFTSVVQLCEQNPILRIIRTTKLIILKEYSWTVHQTRKLNLLTIKYNMVTQSYFHHDCIDQRSNMIWPLKAHFRLVKCTRTLTYCYSMSWP